MSDTKRILLVDDDNEIIEAMRAAFEAKGYEVTVARDGNQGMNAAQKGNIDLMILDMMMPKRSGFVILENLQEDGKLPIPVIMITANEGSRHRVFAEMLGVVDYLRKPFSMEKLIESAERFLNQEEPVT